MKNQYVIIVASGIFSIIIGTSLQAASPQLTKMDLEQLKQAAFSRCQGPYQASVIAPVPVLDPPIDGRADSVGMVYQKELAVRTTNFLDQNGFYFSPRPRAAVNKQPMDIYVDNDNQGLYQLKSWNDANPDFSASAIRPLIDKNSIPPAGRVLTELIIGHVSPKGDYPQLFDLRSSAYVRFAGFPPQVTGASLRLGAHRIFSLGAPGQTGVAEDFPVIRSLYVSAPNLTTARAYVFLESELFCGALSMEMSPFGDTATITIDSYWYTRDDFHWKKDPNTGLVAYSSMFWKREQQDSNSTTDSAHDSDTMIVKFADGTQKRVPLAPPSTGLFVDNLTNDTTPIGWQLINEDLNPAHYADFQANLGNTNYNFRASYDVAILESNVKTGVSLYQQATDGEYGDNIVAVSTLQEDIKKATGVDQFVHFKYRTTAFYPTKPTSVTSTGPDECEFIRQKISTLPAAGGSIDIPAGIFECRSMINLKKSHVKIHGAGRDQTTLRLADQSPAPVLVIGDDNIIQDRQGNWVTATRVSDIEISDLTIDGNLLNQDVHNECGSGTCDGNVAAIRNNGITIRGASNVTIANVTTHSAISGGLVTEKYCENLHVINFTSYGNHFDGFAGYQTQNSLFENVNLSRNHGAGISIDIDFDNNTFSGGLLASNGDVGIFARDIHNIIFENITISNSGNHGAFLADSGQPNTCATGNEFRSVTISGSKGFGIDIASACQGNKVTGKSVFENNSSGCYFVNPLALMSVDASVVCKN